jgi:hypothetical protein
LRCGGNDAGLGFSGDAATQQIERHLGGEAADALTVAEELPVNDERAGGIGDRAAQRCS